MKLNPADAKLFMSLMVPLQWYVNQQAKILPSLKNIQAYYDTSAEEKIKVRDYLFSHTELIDEFIQNTPKDIMPKGLTKEEAAIVSGWKTFIQGDFFIERFLKKQNIFIDDEENVYGVLGLTNAPAEMIDKRSLPVRVQAILLPFKDKIVYDGFLRFYNMSFGGGIRSRLKQTYLIAKDDDGIIETFAPTALATSSKSVQKSAQKSGQKYGSSAKADQNWEPLLEELAAKAKQLRGGSGQRASYSPIFSLVRASIELAQLATEAQPDIDKISKKGRRIDTILAQVENAVLREF